MPNNASQCKTGRWWIPGAAGAPEATSYRICWTPATGVFKPVSTSAFLPWMLSQALGVGPWVWEPQQWPEELITSKNRDPPRPERRSATGTPTWQLLQVQPHLTLQEPSVVQLSRAAYPTSPPLLGNSKRAFLIRLTENVKNKNELSAKNHHIFEEC